MDLIVGTVLYATIAVLALTFVGLYVTELRHLRISHEGVDLLVMALALGTACLYALGRAWEWWPKLDFFFPITMAAIGSLLAHRIYLLLHYQILPRRRERRR